MKGRAKKYSNDWLSNEVLKEKNEIKIKTPKKLQNTSVVTCSYTDRLLYKG